MEPIWDRGCFLSLLMTWKSTCNINAKVWKYVDGTTVSQIVTTGNESNSQSIANRIVQWSLENQAQLNSDKCKELCILFVKNTPEFDPCFR